MNKQLKKYLYYLISPFALGLVVTLGVTYASVKYYESRASGFTKDRKSFLGIVQEIHEKTVDWRLRDRGAAQGSDRVAILAVDDESLRLEGRWPWPRDKVAKLIDRTMMFGAKIIAFDVIFSEEDNNSALPALTRLKSAVSKQKGSGETPLLIDEEASKADLDRIFATSIQANQESLVLGAYSFGTFDIPAYADLCLDAHYARTYSARYWKREAAPLVVIDESLQKLNYPRQMTSHLSSHFLSLESTAAFEWFSENPQASERIKKSLDTFVEGFDTDIYPGIAVMALSNDFEQGKALLEQVDPLFSEIENVRTLFSRFIAGLEKKEYATLQQRIKDTSLEYCSRFFTDRDELLSFANYKKQFPEATDEEFQELSWDGFWTQINAKKPEAERETSAAAIARIKTQITRHALDQIAWWEVNIPLLSEATIHTGLFDAIQDTDGSIRRTRLFFRHGNSFAPSLALKTLLLDKGYSAVARIGVDNNAGRKSKDKVVRSVELIDVDGKQKLKIPADSTANLMINYSGPSFMFPHVPATELLSDSQSMLITVREKDPATGHWNINYKRRVNKREFLKDKLLIVGATAVGVYDLRVTPFEENFPGVETHANTLSNLLIENARANGETVAASAPGFLRIHPLEDEVMWVILLGLGIALAALLAYFESVAGLFIAALAMAAVYSFDKFYLFKNGYISTIVFPIALVLFTFVALTFYKYFTEERKKRALKGTFSKYVSPAIVDEILRDPENIELGGKKMELTVMFSDVRGFTTISEKLDPRALSDLLNSYLTPMTNLVFEHKGTLDKYMGDAVMAFWGAPIHFKDHAKHACRCALAMIVKLKELQAEYRAQNLPEIDIGIGLNTGDMSVGNMGSDTVRSYTVMGDSVNLGSRLEGINKEYGTRIIISEFTYAAVKDSFICREVDWVRVKGKVQPVRIFELISEGKAPEPMAGL
ncbi:MAG: adenylate/guanylate cyclase domain-containing protein, partial [Bdellovibrionota bacterium]